jgi:hypothetical protein
MTDINNLFKMLCRIEKLLWPVCAGIRGDISMDASPYAHGLGYRQFEADRDMNGKALSNAYALLEQAECIATAETFTGAADVLLALRKVRMALSAATANFNAPHIYDGYIESLGEVLTATLTRCGEAITLLAKAASDEAEQETDVLVVSLSELYDRAATMHGNAYNDDIKESLNELRRCLASECFIACMCLCGRMIEAALKMRFIHIPESQRTGIYGAFRKKNSEIGDKELDQLGLGVLIALSKQIGPKTIGWLPEGLANDADKINRFRNSYVHARQKGETPIPSEHDTRSVIHTLADVLSRTYALLGTPPQQLRNVRTDEASNVVARDG